MFRQCPSPNRFDMDGSSEMCVINFFFMERACSERPERAIENSPGCSVAQPRDATPGLCESVILTKVKGIVKCGSRRGLPT